MEKLSPVFSIIIPCYNQEKFLIDCLQSVKLQTFDDWECIIVNDGSTDKSHEIAHTFVQNDNRFQYHVNSNKGLAYTRNFGISKSKGIYILPLDGDDKIGTNYLEKAHNIFNLNPNAKLIYCKAAFFGTKNQQWDLPDYSYEKILIQNCIFCSAIFKKTDFHKTSGYDTNMIFGYEDWELWLQLLNKDDQVIKIESTEFFYRQHENSMISFINNTEKLDLMQTYLLQKHELKYFNFLNINKDLSGFEHLFKNNQKINELLNSFSFQKFYKIEIKIKKLINKWKKKLA